MYILVNDSALQVRPPAMGHLWFHICSNVQEWRGEVGGSSQVHRTSFRVYISQPVKHNLIFKDNLQQKKTKYVLLP